MSDTQDEHFSKRRLEGREEAARAYCKLKGKSFDKGYHLVLEERYFFLVAGETAIHTVDTTATAMVVNRIPMKDFDNDTMYNLLGQVELAGWQRGHIDQHEKLERAYLTALHAIRDVHNSVIAADGSVLTMMRHALEEPEAQRLLREESEKNTKRA